MAWPLAQDYNEAIQSPASSFTDAELKQGEAVTNTLGLPMPRSGNFADVYEFNTPAVRPQSQISSERNTSFRVYTGGLACAERVTVTLKFNDGRTQQVAVDGCRLVSSA